MRRIVGMISLGFALACVSAPAMADTKKGVDAWERGDYPGAVREWRPLAIAGDADAQFNLAQAYRLGRGVPMDMKEAENWYGKAARRGHQKAEDNYGLVLFQNGNRKDAMPWIEKAANRGDARAQYVLGTALFNGDLVGKDWVRAYALMTRASSSGLPSASTTLAQMDKYIPLDQQQRGIALAREIEQQTMRPNRSQIASADIPPSRPGPGTSDSRRDADPPASPAARPAPPRPAPVRPVATPVPAKAGGAWRIQLGAFGEAGRAQALWASLGRSISGLGRYQPYLVKAGAVTKLQAGPFASKAAADTQCAAVRAAGQGCLSIRP